MPTSAFTKVNTFSLELGKGTHNFSTHQLKVALTNTAPTASGTSVYADLTSPLAAGVFSGATPFNVTTTSWTQTGGTAKLVIADLVLTASASAGPFRYVVLYNDTPTSPADPVVGFYDYGSSITLGTGETLTLDWDQSGGAITV